jgi:chromosome segregation ATPase
LEAELQQQRQIDNEKRQGMLRERIHREEIQRQKLADTQLQMKSRVDAVEEEIGEIRKSLKETGGDLTPLKERLKSLQTSKDDLISKTTDLTRQLKELDLVRETFLREVTQNEIDSIRKNTERLTPPTEGVKNAVVKTYNFPPTLTWKHASEFMKIFDGEKGTINIKQDGNQYSLIINASASAHEKAAEYIKKNSLPVK